MCTGLVNMVARQVVAGYTFPVASEAIDVPAVLAKLGEACALQRRAALQYSVAAASLSGPLAALSERLLAFAHAELDDEGALTGKVVALGGEPSTEVASLRWHADSERLLEVLLEDEAEAIEALVAIIPDTGTRGDSEALEHLIEHIVYRKQQQLDFLARAVG